MLRSPHLSAVQQDVVCAPLNSSICLDGQAGTGKTTVGIHRLLHLIESGCPAESILILVPQKSLADGYKEAINSPTFPSGGEPTILTLGGLAQRMISLFWPLIGNTAGFRRPKYGPTFLTLETAQYYLATIVGPLLEQGYFESVTIDPNRLYSQILDNLNKSAVVGFPPEEIAPRLISAWSGKPSQHIIYQQSQDCALLFRSLCYQNNLLDFSLQISVFAQYLWPSLICKSYLSHLFKHLIYDNIEEDFPLAHDIVGEWLANFQTTLMIRDTGSGNRSFLGADPIGAVELSERCALKVTFQNSHVKSQSIDLLERGLTTAILEHKIADTIPFNIKQAFSVHTFRFYPEVVNWTIDQIKSLVDEKNVLPGEIALLTPFLSDALRYSFISRLDAAKIPFSTHRPSRSLHDEPTIKTLLILARISHPSWNLPPSRQEFCTALAHAIQGCDLVRADLIAQVLYQPNEGQETLRPFHLINSVMRERITYAIGEKYEVLRKWLIENSEIKISDINYWISRLFGEVLSQTGFGFHSDINSAGATSRLTESYRKFKVVVQSASALSPNEVDLEYIRVINQGILEAQFYPKPRTDDSEGAVFLSPSFTFLMTNHAVRYQFWIDIGSQGWWSRLEQPLTQPHVLSRNWLTGSKWTDMDEYTANQKTLARVIQGLTRRCREHVFMCAVNINEQGLEERGALMSAVQTVLRSINVVRPQDHV